MTIQQQIHALQQRYRTKVYGRIPLGENGTWGVNVQFHRVEDGAFIVSASLLDLDWTPEDIKRLRANAGVIRLGLEA